MKTLAELHARPTDKYQTVVEWQHAVKESVVFKFRRDVPCRVGRGKNLNIAAVCADKKKRRPSIVWVAEPKGADLLLLGHFEDFWQWVPLVLLPLGLIVVAWQRADRGPRSTRILQGTSVLFLASGVTGLWLHFTANAEFELEMYPSLGAYSGPS